MRGQCRPENQIPMTVQEIHSSRSSPTNGFSEHNFFVRWRHLWEAGSYFRVQGKKVFFCFGFGFLADILVSYSYCNKVPQMGVLRTTEIDCFIVLEARSPKSICWQSHAPSGGAGEVSVLGLSLSFSSFLAWDNTTPIFTWYFPSVHVCPCVQIPSFYKDASHTVHSKRLHFNCITSVKAIPK